MSLTMRFSRVIAGVAVAVASVVAGIAPAPVAAQTPGNTLELSECPWLTDPIVRLYSAYFLRAPEQGGFDFWVQAMDSGTHSLDSMSQFFSEGEEFDIRYGDRSNAEFVTLIYANVLERVPDQAGFDFWVGQLDAGLMTRGRVMRNFSESEENVIKTGTDLPPAGYFSALPAGTEFVCGRDSMVIPVPIAPTSWFGIPQPAAAGAEWTTYIHPIDSAGNALPGAPPATQNAEPANRLYAGFLPVGNTFMQVTVSDGVTWSIVFVPGQFTGDALAQTWVGRNGIPFN